MSEYPADWRKICLKDAGQWLSGGTPSTDDPRYWNGTIPWISSASLKDFEIVDSDRRVTELGAISGTRFVPAGVTIFVVRGMSLKSEFRIGITRREVAFGQDCKAVIPVQGIDSFFLAHALKARSGEVLRLVDEAGHGTGRLSTDQLGGVVIGVPSIPEQRKIVEVLQTADKEIRSMERLVAKLEQAKHALVHALLAYGIGETDNLRPNLRTDRVSETGIAGSPVSWRTLALGEMSEVGGGVALGRSVSGPATIELPYLRVANVQDGYIDTSDIKNVRVLWAEVARYRLQAGDVLMTEGGDFDKLGRGAVWDGSIDPCLHQNHIFRVRCDSSIMLPEFLAMYSASPAGRRYFTASSKQTTNLATINMTQLKAFHIPVPEIQEQVRIVAAMGAYDVEIQREQKALGKLRQLSQGLMDDLLTGRVRMNVREDIPV